MDDEPELTEESLDGVFAASVSFELGLGLVGLVLGWTLGPDARDLIPKLVAENAWQICAGLLFGALAAVPMLIAIEVVKRIPSEAVRALEQFGEDEGVQTLFRLRPIELILLAITSGVGEELLFRGWMLRCFAGFGNAEADPSQLQIVIALIVSSIFFGLVHPITKLYVFLAAVMGLYFGALMLFTDNLLIPIVAHATYNAAQMLMEKAKQKVLPT